MSDVLACRYAHSIVLQGRAPTTLTKTRPLVPSIVPGMLQKALALTWTTTSARHPQTQTMWTDLMTSVNIVGRAFVRQGLAHRHCRKKFLTPLSIDSETG